MTVLITILLMFVGIDTLLEKVTGTSIIWIKKKYLCYTEKHR